MVQPIVRGCVCMRGECVSFHLAFCNQRLGGNTHPIAQLGQPKPTDQYSHLEECATEPATFPTKVKRVSLLKNRIGEKEGAYHGSLSRRDSPANFLFLPAFVWTAATDFKCSISAR